MSGAGSIRVGFGLLALLVSANLPARALCPADCNGDAAVTVDELVRGVRIALGEALSTSARRPMRTATARWR